MNPGLDRDDTTTRGAAAAGAAEASAGSAASPSGQSRRDAGAEPVAVVAGTGGVATGAAGAGSPLDPMEDECGVIPAEPAGNVASARVSGAGLVEYDVATPNAFVGLRTTLTVPATPPPSGPVFVWPGVQPAPEGMNLQPIGNGAVLSALSWGGVCPTDAPEAYSTWWIAPVYSNFSSSDPQYSGCHGGDIALAEPGQRLDIDIRLDGTTWVQKVVNRDTGAASDFSLDLKGQEQGRAIFAIGLQTNNKPTEDVVFTHTVLSMDASEPSVCEPVLRGTNDFASRPRVSADGTRCCIDRIVLRAPRVMATTQDPP